MKAQKIQELLRLGEGLRVEFKASLRAMDAIGREVCGFLNTSGGYVVCGVADDGAVTGVDVSDEKLAAFEKKLHDEVSPKAFVSVHREVLTGKPVIVIEAPQGRDVPYSYRNVIYIRDGGRTRPADSGTIRDMVLRAQVEPERWERRFSLADLEADIEFGEIVETVDDAKRAQRVFFRDPTDPVRILEDLSVVRYGRLTNGGDVLFTKNPALRLPQVRVRAAAYNSDKAGEAFRDMKSFEGPLHAVFGEAYAFIVRNTPTIARFRKSTPKREDSPLYPEEAVREALINALVHRDYSSSSGGVSVHIFPKRLEIWNSGSLPDGVTPAGLAKGHISVLRNPDIAHVVYLRGLMEKAGRGSVLVIQECLAQGLPAPQWTSDEKLGVTLTFFATEVTTEVTTEVATEVTTDVLRLIASLEGEMLRRELQARMSLKNDEHFRKAYLAPALRSGLVEMTDPSKPRSSKQRYRLTPAGKRIRARRSSSR